MGGGGPLHQLLWLSQGTVTEGPVSFPRRGSRYCQYLKSQVQKLVKCYFCHRVLVHQSQIPDSRGGVKRPSTFHGRSIREFVDKFLNCHMSQTCSFCNLHLPVIWATRIHLQLLSFPFLSIQSSGSSGDSLPKHVHNPSVLSSPL